MKNKDNVSRWSLSKINNLAGIHDARDIHVLGAILFLFVKRRQRHKLCHSFECAVSGNIIQCYSKAQQRLLKRLFECDE